MTRFWRSIGRTPPSSRCEYSGREVSKPPGIIILLPVLRSRHCFWRLRLRKSKLGRLRLLKAPFPETKIRHFELWKGYIVIFYWILFVLINWTEPMLNTSLWIFFAFLNVAAEAALKRQLRLSAPTDKKIGPGFATLLNTRAGILPCRYCIRVPFGS